MHLKKIVIKNFRLLHDVYLLREEQTTVIVRRNNSGNTSLTEVMRSTTRLALLFSQLLSNGAFDTPRTWFGADAVQAFSP